MSIPQITPAARSCGAPSSATTKRANAGTTGWRRSPAASIAALGLLLSVAGAAAGPFEDKHQKGSAAETATIEVDKSAAAWQPAPLPAGAFAGTIRPAASWAEPGSRPALRIGRAGPHALGPGGRFTASDQGDTLATAEDLALGGTATGEIDVPGDVDVFRITTTARVNVDVHSTGDADVVGTLLDAAGLVVESDDDGGELLNFRIRATLGAGEHYVQVAGYGGKAVGAYGIAAVDEGVDHADLPPGATELVIDGSAQDGRIYPAGDLDFFRIETAEETEVRISTTGEADTFGTLYDEGGGWLAADDDGGEGFNFLIETTLAAGIHYIAVGGYGDKHVGSYSVAAQTAGPDPNVVASWSGLGVTFLPSEPATVKANVDILAFDGVSRESIEITGLATTSHSVAIHGAPTTSGGNVIGTQTAGRVIGLRTASGGGLRGTQRYDIYLTCEGPGEPQSYDALMLFDRSGSMASNDPQGVTIRAGRRFVEHLDSSGHALVAQFTTDLNDGVEFFASEFSNERDPLLEDIDRLRPPSGGTPLWNAMSAAVGQFDSAAGSGDRRALIVFSDGEDTEGGTTPSAVIQKAKASREDGGDVAVYSVKLRTDSGELNRIAEETGGAVYTTDNVETLLAYYGTLGKLLSGDATRCMAAIDATFEAPDALEVGFGPGVRPEPVDLVLIGKTAGGRTSKPVLTLALPFAPGVRVGSTGAGGAVFSVDFDQQGGTPSRVRCFEDGVNICAEAIYVSLCAADGSECHAKAVAPGETWAPYAGEHSFGACRWDAALHDTYVPVVLDNASGDDVYETFTERGEAAQFDCAYSGRFGITVATFTDPLASGGKGPEMAVVPAGSFQMGCLNDDGDCGLDEFPVHEVDVPRFALSKHEVTFDQWEACVAAGGCNGHSPRDYGNGRGDRPVTDVSWHDAQAYVAWLSVQTGAEYRLPSEAEWEYAARAGTATKYHWGDDVGTNRANCDGCGSQWDGSRAAPVGSFDANPWGLHDMHGNVWEWTADCWNYSYAGAPSDGRAWLSGACGFRVMRGGSWNYVPRLLRSANRIWVNSGGRYFSVGFRVARTLTP